MTSLNLGSHQLPLNAATKTFAVLAKRGAGKTYTGGVMAEEFFAQNIPFVVFDPIDVWWGLRFAADGKSKGIPVVVFGLEHADIQIDRDMGRRIAQAVVKHNVSCVISTFGMPKVAQRHLIAEFADEILNINNTPRHIFIEEAHEFVPQRVMGAMAKTFNAVSNLIVMGRNRGLGVTILNQRAATVNKDVLTQIDTLLAFRNTSPQDRKALKEWVEHHSAEGDFNRFMQSLPSLPTGEGWIWSPEFMGIFDRIKIRERRTFHPDREKLGDSFEMPTLERVDIQDFIHHFSQDAQAATAKSAAGEADGKKSTPPTTKKEEPETIPLERHTAELRDLRNQYEAQLMQKDIEIRKRDDMLNQILRILNGNGTVTANSAAYSMTAPPTSSATYSGTVDLWLSKLGKGQPSVILRFLAEKSGLRFTRSQVALACGYSARGGGFRNALSLLRRNNLIKEEGDHLQLHPDLAS